MGKGIAELGDAMAEAIRRSGHETELSYEQSKRLREAERAWRKERGKPGFAPQRGVPTTQVLIDDELKAFAGWYAAAGALAAESKVLPMRAKILLLDCDEPLAKFNEGFLLTLGQITGEAYGPDDVTEWDYASIARRSPRHADAVREAFKVAGAAGWCSRLRPCPEAVRAVGELKRERGLEIYVVTSPFPSPTWVHERERWLGDHFGIHRKKIVHTAAKELVRGDVFVDDHVGHVARWQECHLEGAGLVWDRPYNRDYPGRRARGWRCVREALGLGAA